MRSRRPQPFCRSYETWLKHHYGKSCLAPLTGQDRTALEAFVHLLHLYAHADDEGRQYATQAMASTVLAMQEHVRYLASRCIPHVLDWGDEPRLWLLLMYQAERESSRSGSSPSSWVLEQIDLAKAGQRPSEPVIEIECREVAS